MAQAYGQREVHNRLYVGGGGLFVIDVEIRNQEWRFVMDSDIGSPVILDGIVYAGFELGYVDAIVASQPDDPELEAGGAAEIAVNDSVLRGGPGETTMLRAELDGGDGVTITGESEVAADGVEWWPVTVDDTGEVGWVKGEDLVAVFPDE